MRVLIEGGLPHLGDRFPSRWKESLPTANPEGFYESRLRRGVYYATNPDPETGEYLTAAASRHHAVKIFIPGVIRTERAYLDRVLATLRSWRAYTRSRAKLEAEEDAWLAEHPRPGLSAEESLARVERSGVRFDAANAGDSRNRTQSGDGAGGSGRQYRTKSGAPIMTARESRSLVPPPIEWFLENYELVRDFSTRRYAMHFVSYERMMAEPQATIAQVFAWLGRGDVDAAAAVVDPTLRRSSEAPPTASEASVSADDAALFDAFHDAIHANSALPASLVADLNAAWKRLSARYHHPSTRDS